MPYGCHEFKKVADVIVVSLFAAVAPWLLHNMTSYYWLQQTLPSATMMLQVFCV